MLKRAGTMLVLLLALVAGSATAQVAMRGTVWGDTNASGAKDVGESPLAGWTIYLDANGNGLLDGGESSLVSDANGRFNFKGQPAGTYTIREVSQATWSQTFPVSGSHTVTLADLEIAEDLNFGNVQYGGIEGVKWDDIDGDGTRNGNETALQGWTIYLDINSNGALDSGETSVVTDGNGAYSFDNLFAKTFTVAEVAQPGWTQTFPVSGTHSVTVAAGQTVGSINFGNRQVTASIGDYVWDNADGDGVQDATESGMSGVTVHLWSTDSGGDALLGSTISDASGHYSFTGLIPGDYRISVDVPVGYLLSDHAGGADPALNSDIILVTGKTAVITLTAGEINNDIDVGLEQSASLGGRVWLDANRDGIQDAGEPGVENVTANLLVAGGAVEQTTTTDANGQYVFSGLRSSFYSIDVQPSSIYGFTQQNAGSDDAIDSDVSSLSGTSATIYLLPGDSALIDAGLIQASIGDFVWDNANGNGIQDASESGMSGVTVFLWTTNSVLDELSNSTITDAGGHYSFTGLIPGDYRISVDVPAGYLLSDHAGGADPALNSDIILVTGKTGVITLAVGEQNNDIDVGLEQSVSLGDKVWLDSDGNGIQDVGEPGVENVTVNLMTPGGFTVLATSTTDASGAYDISGIRSGLYRIAVQVPANYGITQRDAGSDDAIDSDIAVSSGMVTFTTQPGENNTSIDIGLTEGLIGDYVWENVNGDGVQDASESGMAGVAVHLWSTDSGGDALLGSTISDASGHYSFTGLNPGDYRISVDVPAGYLLSDRATGADPTLNSDIILATGKTDLITLVAGEINNDIDVGLELPVAIGDRVWLDVNGDGIQDAGEPGVENVTVMLRVAGGAVQATTTTDASGLYGFSGLRSKLYTILVQPPSDYGITQEDAGSDDATDSDVHSVTGGTIPFMPLPGDNDMTIDAGLTLASIGDYVWEDTGNGLQDASESGMSGVNVHLWLARESGDVLLSSTTSAPNGRYRFTGLEPDDYRVSVDIPTGYVLSLPVTGSGQLAVNSDIVPNTGKTPVITLATYEINNDIDVGLMIPGQIGDRVWMDLNGDGIQDTGEPGVENVTIDLLAPSGFVGATTTTDATGEYSFSVRPGYYYVQFHLPSNYTFTQRNAGSDDELDSDATASGITSQILHLLADDMSIDAGIVPVSTIGDFVWHDLNANGVQDAGEPGVSGVAVELYRADITSTILVANTTSDTDGAYSFSGLAPGSYHIKVVSPVGFGFTSQHSGTDDESDSDVDAATGESSPRNISASSPTDFNVDAGLVSQVGISGNFWIDYDGDEIRSAVEPGFGGIEVDLNRAGTGETLQTVTTDNAGNYSFSNLLPGSYFIEPTLPDGFAFVAQNQGSDTTADSDIDPVSGQSGVVLIDANNSQAQIDGGLRGFSWIGDFVWRDVNRNGIQDAGEPGIDNVELGLRSGCAIDDPIVATTFSSSAGAYSFDRLPMGSYRIRLIFPSEYGATELNAGLISEDSDLEPSPEILAHTGCISVGNATGNPGIDMGLHFAVVGNFVWHDLDGNGIQDAGEPGLENVYVQLNGCTGGPDCGSIIGTDLTDTSGQYQIDLPYAWDNVSSIFEAYQLVVIPPSGFAFTLQNQTADQTDSDVDQATGMAFVEPVTYAGEANLDYDVGLILASSISGYVFRDLNNDGIQNGNDPRSGDVLVRLSSRDSNSVWEDEADASGRFKILAVPPGTYDMEVSSSGGLVVASRDPVIVDLETTVTDLGVALVEASSIGNLVWYDADRNGIQGDAEPGVAGFEVALEPVSACPATGFAQAVSTTTTNRSGIYSFTALAPGSYRLFVPSWQDQNPNRPDTGGHISTEFGPTIRDQGDGSNDSDHPGGDEGGGYDGSICVTLSPGDHLSTVDIGVHRAVIGDYVWIDQDGDGVQDADENGLEGVSVSIASIDFIHPLTGVNGLGSPYATTVTDQTGWFEFELPTAGGTTRNDAGSVTHEAYQLTFEAPAGYVLSPAKQAAAGRDSDPDPVTGTIIGWNSRGQADFEVDAGMSPLASIGDFVWEDSNGNGIQDLDEFGVENVSVILKQWDGSTFSLAGAQDTDADGAYLFQNLVPGDYRIQVVLPDAYASFSPADQGNDSAIDSNVNSTTGVSKTVTIGAPQLAVHDIDSGLLPPAYLELLVWEDLNNDGVRNTGDQGASIPVEIYADNTLVTLLMPGNDGTAVLGPVPPGSYHVVIDPATASGVGYTIIPRLEVDPLLGVSVTKAINTGRTVNFSIGLESTGQGGRMVQFVNDSPDILSLDILIHGEEVVSGLSYRHASELIPVDSDATTVIHRSVTSQDPSNSHTGSWLLPELDGDVLVLFESGDSTSPVILPKDYPMNDSDGPPSPAIIQKILDRTNPVTIQVNTQLSDRETVASESLTFGQASGFLDWGETNPPRRITISIGQFGFSAEHTPATNDPAFTAIILSGYQSPEAGQPKLGVVGVKTDGSTVAFQPSQASISGTAWFDFDADGSWDALEPALSGVTLRLIAPSGAAKIGTTDQDGNYLFENLIAGSYAVEQVLGPGETQTWPLEASHSIILTEGENRQEVDFGVYKVIPNARVIGGKYHDLNANGDRDSGEPPVEGWTFEAVAIDTDILAAYDPGVTTEAVTDATGAFEFTLPPGSYQIREESREDWIYTFGGIPSGTSQIVMEPGENNSLILKLDVLTMLSSAESLLIEDSGLSYGNHEQGPVTDATPGLDAGDADPGDGVCDDGTGHCPLRAAIEHVIGTGQLGTVHLTSGSGKRQTIINLLQPLPEITSPVLITGDGTVTLDGSQAGFGANGLTISADNTFISGIGLTHFSGHGILIQGGNAVVIENNSISENGGDGVRVLSGSGHTIRRNTIFGNGGLPIDLGGDGRTANDFNDTDSGVNGLPNAPVLTFAWPGSLTIEGTIGSAPLTDLSIDVYFADTCRPLLIPEASHFAGSVDVRTDITGFGSFRVTLDAEVSLGGYASATSTMPDGSTSEFSECLMIGEPPVRVAIEEPAPELPNQVTLYQNYPNPFNPVTRLAFDLPVSAPVRLEVYDILGRRVRTVLNDLMQAGHHEVTFDASRLASGLYFYRLVTTDFVSTKKMVVIK